MGHVNGWLRDKRSPGGAGAGATARRALIAAIATAAALCGAPAARAADALQLLREAVERARGYGDYSATVTMRLRDRSGAEVVRKMEIRRLEVSGDGLRTLVVFEGPPDVSRMKLLTAAHASGAEEQWVYLPAFGRAKQISPAQQAAAFMRSELTFEDIAALDLDLAKFSYRYLREEALGGAPCLVVERVPTYERSSYRRQVMWLDAKERTVRRIEYFDREDRLQKTLTVEGYESHLGRYLVPRRMRMENQQTGRSTLLEWEGYRFRSGLDPAQFEVPALASR